VKVCPVALWRYPHSCRNASSFFCLGEIFPVKSQFESPLRMILDILIEASQEVTPKRTNRKAKHMNIWNDEIAIAL
jgi:hypothetical protein